MSASARLTIPKALECRLPEGLLAALDLVGLALLAFFLAGFVDRNVLHQGDLRTYRLAAQVALRGGDPYQPGALSALAGHHVFPFVYPPIAIVPFLGLADLALKTAASVWIWVKLGLLGALVFAWGRWFTRDLPQLPLALVAIFGWNASAQWDLATGNVAILECALVWAGLACFAAGRRTWFALLIVAAACFKLAPAAFLLLLLVPTGGTPASPRRLALSLGLLGVLVLGPVVAGPASHFERFWAHVPEATTDGAANPSALGLLTLLAHRVGIPGTVAGQVARIGLLAYAAALIACSLPLLRDTWKTRDALRWVMTAVFLYVLLLPRPMAYGFVMLIPAPLFFAPKPFDGLAGKLVLAMLLAAQGLWRLTMNASDSALVIYAPLLLSLCVWLLVVNEHATGSATVGAGRRRRGRGEPRPIAA